MNKKTFERLFLKHLFISPRIILVLLVAIVNSLLASSEMHIKYGIFNNLVCGFNSFWNTFLIIILFLLNYVYIYDTLSSDEFKIRINNLKELNKCTLKYSLFYNLFSFLIIIVCNFIAYLIKYDFNIAINYYFYYNIYDYIYCVFFLIKTFIITFIICKLNIIIYSFFKNKATLSLTLITYIYPYVFSAYHTGIVNNILDFKFFFYDYYATIQYSSFIFEIFMTIMYIILIEVISDLIEKKFINMRGKYEV